MYLKSVFFFFGFATFEIICLSTSDYVVYIRKKLISFMLNSLQSIFTALTGKTLQSVTEITGKASETRLCVKTADNCN